MKKRIHSASSHTPPRTLGARDLKAVQAGASAPSAPAPNATAIEYGI